MEQVPVLKTHPIQIPPAKIFLLQFGIKKNRSIQKELGLKSVNLQLCLNKMGPKLYKKF